ncbi:hypothetical protein AEQU1_00623 [Aequorivita sp. CIP111184]|nr:hypothetical protein AEQU1_00623 [Aequorivita sp. CIP111184]
MFSYKFLFFSVYFFGAERKKFVKQEGNTLRDVMFYKSLVFSVL